MAPPSAPFAARPCRRRSGVRGFTLIELMVAIMAGVFVSAAAFAFARASSRAYQQDVRLSTATSAANLGFRRLMNDLQRASYLGTPNIQRDRRDCQNLTIAPPGIRDLAGIQIRPFGSYSGPTNPSSALNGTAPDTLIVAGSFDATDDFPVVVQGTGPTLTLTFKRNFEQAAGADRLGVAGLQRVFATGRIVRIVNEQGLMQFGTVNGTAISGNGDFQANVDGVFASPLNCPAKAGSATSTPATPFSGFTGVMANVVNRARYELMSLASTPGFGELYPASDKAIGAGQSVPIDTTNKVELVRTELDSSGNPLGTPELIAEYAVDLRFGGRVDAATSVGNQGMMPNIVGYDPTLPFGAASAFYTYTGAASATPTTAGPERLRSVSVRLGIRSREFDRRYTGSPPTAGAGMYRFLHPTELRWARMRTLSGEVFLANQSIGEGAIL